jgi:hypothetical protein
MGRSFLQGEEPVCLLLRSKDLLLGLDSRLSAIDADIERLIYQEVLPQSFSSSFLRASQLQNTKHHPKVTLCLPHLRSNGLCLVVFFGEGG